MIICVVQHFFPLIVWINRCKHCYENRIDRNGEACLLRIWRHDLYYDEEIRPSQLVVVYKNWENSAAWSMSTQLAIDLCELAWRWSPERSSWLAFDSMIAHNVYVFIRNCSVCFWCFAMGCGLCCLCSLEFSIAHTFVAIRWVNSSLQSTSTFDERKRESSHYPISICRNEEIPVDRPLCSGRDSTKLKIVSSFVKSNFSLTIATEAFIPFVHETIVHCVVLEVIAIRLQLGFDGRVTDPHLWTTK